MTLDKLGTTEFVILYVPLRVPAMSRFLSDVELGQLFPTLRTERMDSSTRPLYVTGAIRVIVTNPIPGDANRDGIVDDSDAAILAGNWQTATGATWDMGDFNSDGAVDDIDSTLLAANWQQTSEGDATVPEPSTFAGLLGLCLAGLLASSRRKR